MHFLPNVYIRQPVLIEVPLYQLPLQFNTQFSAINQILFYTNYLAKAYAKR